MFQFMQRCAECGRVFDLLSADSASEFFGGHDCDANVLYFGHDIAVIDVDAFTAILTRDGREVRTYRGETALMDATRDATDAVLAVMYQ